MNNDDVPRSSVPLQQPGRRPALARFQDARFNSPSSNYNFNSSAGYNQNAAFSGPQHPKRRIDRFKRESINYNDRMIRQNDSIIRLLKEIRDRLPAPPQSERVAGENDAVVQDVNLEQGVAENNEPMAENSAPEEDHVPAENGGDDQFEDTAEQQPE